MGCSSDIDTFVATSSIHVHAGSDEMARGSFGGDSDAIAQGGYPRLFWMFLRVGRWVAPGGDGSSVGSAEETETEGCPSEHFVGIRNIIKQLVSAEMQKCKKKNGTVSQCHNPKPPYRGLDWPKATGNKFSFNQSKLHITWMLNYKKLNEM
jgi:hypothetical protein